MATKYARASGGNWNTDATWSTTSSAGAANTVKPTAGDDVVLDSGSGQVTIDAASVCRSIDCTGYTNTLTHNAFTLTIGDGTAGTGNIALKFVSGMTYTRANSTTSAIAYASTSTTLQTIDYGGKLTGNISFTGTGGKWAFITGFTTASVATLITLTRGTLQTDGTANNSGLTHSWGYFDSNNSNTRTLDLGTSNITIRGTNTVTVRPWDFTTVTNLTFNATSSTITMSGTATGGNITYFSGGGLSYGTVNFKGESSAPTQTNLSGVNTFVNLSITGTAIKSNQYIIGGNQTVTGNLSFAGNSAINRVLISASAAPTTSPRVFTITSATFTGMQNVDFRDISFSTGTTDLSGITGGSGDCGGNSGITFTTSATQTWSGTSGGTWSGNAWTTRVPLPQDNVNFSGINFASSQTVTIDMPRIGRNISVNNTTTTVTLSLNSMNFSVYGSFTFGNSVNTSATSSSTMFFDGRSAFSFDRNGRTIGGVTIRMVGGSLSLSDTLTCLDLTLNNGTLIDNGFTVTTSTSFTSSNSNTRAITKTGNWVLSGTGTVWNTNTTTGMTFSDTAGSISLTNTSATSKTFAGGGLTYNILSITVGGSGAVIITGGNTFNQIRVSGTGTKTIQFTAGTTTTLTGSENGFPSGTSGNLITIQSTSNGSAWNLVKTSGYIQSDYISLRDSAASGGAIFNAGANSTNVSGNSGWNFTDFRITPTVLDGVLTIQDPLEISNLTFLADILEVASDIQGVTFTMDVNFLADALDLSLTLQEPQIVIDTIVVSDFLEVVSDVQNPTFDSSVTFEPVVLSLSSELLDPSIRADVIVLPDSQDLTVSILSPNNLIDATVTPGTLDLVLEIQNPNFETSTVVAVEVLDLISSIVSPNIKIDATVEAELLTVLSEVLNPAIVNIQGIRICLDIKRNHILNVKIIQDIYRNVDIKRTITRNFKRG